MLWHTLDWFVHFIMVSPWAGLLVQTYKNYVQPPGKLSGWCCSHAFDSRPGSTFAPPKPPWCGDWWYPGREDVFCLGI